MTPQLQPLNGKWTRPLTAYALVRLRRILEKPLPAQLINPGTADRLRRGELVELVMLPSPFKTTAGRLIEHLQITDKGREELAKERT